MWAYVPGKTPRHPEGAFDDIRQSVVSGMTAEALAQTTAFQTGLHYLETGYFWEAHEVLEPVWMALPQDSEARQFVQALIQVANAALKREMDRPKASLRLCDIAVGLLTGLRSPIVMSVEVAAVQRRIDALKTQQEL